MFPSPSGFYLISIQLLNLLRTNDIRVSVPFGVLSNINVIMTSAILESAVAFPSPSGFYLISMIREKINGKLITVSVPFGVLSNINKENYEDIFKPLAEFPSPSGFYLISMR